MTWNVQKVCGDWVLVSQTIGDRIFFQEDHAVFEYRKIDAGLEIVAKHPPNYEPGNI